MYELAAALRDDLETFLLAAPCEVDVMLTAAEPPSPVGECSIVYVWIPDVEDRNQFLPTDHRTLGLLTINYRIHKCFTEEARDLTAQEEATIAECFYGLMEAIWCGLVDAKDDNTLMGFPRCSEIVLEPMVTERGGSEVRATGAVQVPFDCSVQEGSST
jgi:hypothetical protein